MFNEEMCLHWIGKESFDMLTINAMTTTDNKMTSLALHGVKAPSQVFHAVSGLAGATGDSGTLKPLLKPVSGLSEFLADYIESKNKFEAELRTTLQEAQKAASSMEAMEYARTERKEHAAEAAHAAAEPKQASVPTEDSVEKVATFADRYNDLKEFLQENKEVSGHAASVSSAVNDASGSMKTFSAIGITSDANGKLHVNASRLAASLKNRPESVEYALGKDGLAGRAKKSIKLAEFNKDKLFPSVSSAMGREENPAKSMYSPKAVAAQNDFKDRGSMLNLYS